MMTQAVLFVVVALRAVIELVVWVILGRAMLRLLAGRGGSDNTVLRLFDFFLAPLRALLGKLWPKAGFASRECLLLGLLISFWLGLGVAKWWLLA